MVGNEKSQFIPSTYCRKGSEVQSIVSYRGISLTDGTVIQIAWLGEWLGERVILVLDGSTSVHFQSAERRQTHFWLEPWESTATASLTGANGEGESYCNPLSLPSRALEWPGVELW